ncbi:MAG: DUF4163 domain-containing protein [Niabella sp.]
MNNRFLIFIVLVLSFSACKNQDKKTTSQAPANPTATAVENSFSDPYFYKTLEGAIAGKPIEMHFLKYNDNVDANYFYVEKGQPVFLYKDWDKSGKDSIYLFEDTPDSLGRSAKIALFISNNGLNGVWTSADRKSSYPVVLRARTQQSTLHFNAFGYTDSAKYTKFKTDTPTLKSTMAIVGAVDKNERAAWLNGSLQKTLVSNNKFASISLQQMPKTLVEHDVKGYKADVDSSLAGVSDDAGGHYFLNREYITTGNIIYNGNGYVVYSIYSYAYTGGAHGMYGTGMYCFDVENKKQLAFNDIVKADSLAISGLLEKSYRAKFNLPSSTPITDRLFVNAIPLNKNFYFSPKGLGFIYTPYEIASYADGEINLWIPFSDLKPYLTTAFINRMHL